MIQCSGLAAREHIPSCSCGTPRIAWPLARWEPGARESPCGLPRPLFGGRLAERWILLAGRFPTAASLREVVARRLRGSFQRVDHWTGGGWEALPGRDTIRDYHESNEARSQEELVGPRWALPSSARSPPWTHPRPCKTPRAYIGSWLKALQNNPKWVLKASKQARDAVEFVLTGRLPEGKGRAAATA